MRLRAVAHHEAVLLDGMWAYFGSDTESTSTARNQMAAAMTANSETTPPTPRGLRGPSSTNGGRRFTCPLSAWLRGETTYERAKFNLEV